MQDGSDHDLPEAQQHQEQNERDSQKWHEEPIAQLETLARGTRAGR